MGEYDERCGPLLTKRQRQFIDHRTGKTTVGFASSGSKPPDIDGRPRQAEGEIRNQKAVSSHFGTVVSAFANDLQRIEKFYNGIEKDSEEFIHLIWANKEAIRSLDHVTQRLKALADSHDETWDERMDAYSNRQLQLHDILSPLYDGLRDSENPQQEFDSRIETVKTICQHELTEILRYIADTPEREQISEDYLKQQKDNSESSWNHQQYATRVLESDLGVVHGKMEYPTKSRKQFTLTEKGELVLKTLDSLLDSEYIEQWQKEGESREIAAFKALSQPYPDI